MATVNLIIKITINEGKEDDFWAVMKPCITASRAEAGCTTYDVCTDKNNKRNVWIYENWASQAAYEAHEKTEHLAKVFGAM